MAVRDYRDLVVWQRAMALARESYALSRLLPLDERFALAAQIRRAAGSVGANIVEGHSRGHRKEFLQFLAIAHASLHELEHHLLLASTVGELTREQIATALELADQGGRMLRAMRARLAAAPPRRSTLDARRSDAAPPQHTAARKRSQS